jgi:hypothetical protein
MTEGTTMKTRKMTAKFAGTCGACGGSIAKGEKIVWAKGVGADHAECPESDDYTMSCGCSDYHYADCPTRTSFYGYD